MARLSGLVRRVVYGRKYARLRLTLSVWSITCATLVGASLLAGLANSALSTATAQNAEQRGTVSKRVAGPSG